MTNRIAHRYALALLEEAEQRNIVEKVAEDLTLVRDTIESVSLLRSALTTPVIRPNILNNVMTELFASRVSLEVMNFVKLLVQKSRGSYISSAAEDFHLLLDKKNNLVSATITSAKQLDEAAQQKIVAKLEQYAKAKIRPTYAVDESLKGGFIAKVGDTLIDASLSHQLEVLREQFKAASVPSAN